MSLILASIATQSNAFLTWQGIVSVIVYGLVGVGLLWGTYFVFDKLTPGDLHGEIMNNKNSAAATLAGSVIVAAAIIFAAAIVG